MTTFDTLILNRNLKNVTETLAQTIRKLERADGVFVIDAGSRLDEVSSLTLVRDDTPEATSMGLRIARGFNLGIRSWMQLNREVDWLLLLPNDSELEHESLAELLDRLSNTPQIAAIVPTYPGDPYQRILEKQPISLGWHIPEGPILVSTRYIKERFLDGCDEIFDSSNFRGFLLYLELSLRLYSNDYGIVLTNMLRFRENQSYLLNEHQLIGTEPYSENQRLLLDEGRQWLIDKFGYGDRRALENLVRLTFEEFVRVHGKLYPEAS